MVDLIDNIHVEERKELEQNLNFIKPEMKEWQEKKIEPLDFEVFVIGKVIKEEALDKKKLEREEQIESIKEVRKYDMRLSHLSDLCK